MNQREKTLAVVTSGLLGVLGLLYCYWQISAALASRDSTVRKLKQDIVEKEKRMRVARRAAQRLNVYREMSLPENHELGSSLYQTWLLNHLTKAGFTGVKLTATSSRGRTKALHLHSFSVSASGDLAQTVRLLHQFYSLDQLHRVRQLRLQPVKDSKSLSLSMIVDAAAVQKPDNADSLTARPANRLEQASLDEYMRTIVGRNIFGPANKPPRLASPGPQKGSPNVPLSFSLKASDPDPLDKIAYALDGEPPAGATIDPQTGRFQWTAKENGEFEVTVVATDNGFPAKSDRQAIKLVIADPPPPPPPAPEPPPMKKPLEFDNARHTYLTAITEVNGRPQLWFTVRTTGEILRLKTGDKLDVGSIQGTVKAIHATSVDVAYEDKSLTVALGDPLVKVEEPAEPAGAN